jgi:hypothetical protein
MNLKTITLRVAKRSVSKSRSKPDAMLRGTIPLMATTHAAWKSRYVKKTDVNSNCAKRAMPLLVGKKRICRSSQVTLSETKIHHSASSALGQSWPTNALHFYELIVENIEKVCPA